jgi:hypothetical protein
MKALVKFSGTIQTFGEILVTFEFYSIAMSNLSSMENKSKTAQTLLFPQPRNNHYYEKPQYNKNVFQQIQNSLISKMNNSI